jgi:hypothetical protein
MTKFKLDKYNIRWKTTFSYINFRESRSDNQQYDMTFVRWHHWCNYFLGTFGMFSEFLFQHSFVWGGSFQNLYFDDEADDQELEYLVGVVLLFYVVYKVQNRARQTCIRLIRSYEKAESSWRQKWTFRGNNYTNDAILQMSCHVICIF